MNTLRNLTAATAVAAMTAGLITWTAHAEDATTTPASTPTAATTPATSAPESTTEPTPATAPTKPDEPLSDSLPPDQAPAPSKPAPKPDPEIKEKAQNSGVAVVSDMDLQEAIKKYGGENDPRTAWMSRSLNPAFVNQVVGLDAYSPAMNRHIPLAVITPNGKFDNARPTIYLLNGAGGAEQAMDWITMTAFTDVPDEENVIKFYQDKNVNVVIPMAGAFSYYTDWVQEPNSSYLSGPQKWETFLTEELPGPLEAKINGNGKRAIAGMSMSATSSLLLAEHNPGLYDAVGSYSGCAATSTPIPNFYAQLTVNRGGANVSQMWGPMGGKYNVFNDALVNANNLRDTAVYVSTNSGLAGAPDLMSSRLAEAGSAAAFSQSSTLLVEGGLIEAAMSSCTHDLKAKMDRLGIPADWNFRSTGTHSWPGWRADIHESWPTFARAFGME